MNRATFMIDWERMLRWKAHKDNDGYWYTDDGERIFFGVVVDVPGEDGCTKYYSEPNWTDEFKYTGVYAKMEDCFGEAVEEARKWGGEYVTICPYTED